MNINKQRLLEACSYPEQKGWRQRTKRDRRTLWDLATAKQQQTFIAGKCQKMSMEIFTPLMIILKKSFCGHNWQVLWRKLSAQKWPKAKIRPKLLQRTNKISLCHCFILHQSSLTDYGQLAWKRYWGGRIIHTDRTTTTTVHCPCQIWAQQSQPQLADGRPGTNKAFLHKNRPSYKLPTRYYGHWYRMSNFQNVARRIHVRKVFRKSLPTKMLLWFWKSFRCKGEPGEPLSPWIYFNSALVCSMWDCLIPNAYYDYGSIVG